MLAVKFHEDDYYKNTFYAKLGGVGDREMNLLELELLNLLQYRLCISTEIFVKYRDEVYLHLESLCNIPSPCPSPCYVFDDNYGQYSEGMRSPTSVADAVAHSRVRSFSPTPPSVHVNGPATRLHLSHPTHSRMGSVSRVEMHHQNTPHYLDQSLSLNLPYAEPNFSYGHVPGTFQNQNHHNHELMSSSGWNDCVPPPQQQFSYVQCNPMAMTTQSQQMTGAMYHPQFVYNNMCPPPPPTEVYYWSTEANVNVNVGSTPMYYNNNSTAMVQASPYVPINLMAGSTSHVNHVHQHVMQVQAKMMAKTRGMSSQVPHQPQQFFVHHQPYLTPAAR